MGKLVQCPFMVKLTMHVTMGGENMGFSWKPKLLTWLWRCRNWFQVGTASSASSMVQNSKVRSLHGECDGWSFRNGQNSWREKGERLAEIGVVSVTGQKEWCCRRSQMHKGDRRRKMVKKISTGEAWSMGRTVGLDGRKRWVRTGERRKQTDKGENFCLKVIWFFLFINNLSSFFFL